MDISKFLGKVLGIYFLVISAAILFDVQGFVTNNIRLLQDPPLLFITGFFTLIIGILMIVSHQIWCCNWRVLITMVGWLTFIKGVCLIICPNWITLFSNHYLITLQYLNIVTVITLILGIFFCYKGFR